MQENQGNTGKQKQITVLLQKTKKARKPGKNPIAKERTEEQWPKLMHRQKNQLKIQKAEKIRAKEILAQKAKAENNSQVESSLSSEMAEMSK